MEIRDNSHQTNLFKNIYFKNNTYVIISSVIRLVYAGSELDV